MITGVTKRGETKSYRFTVHVQVSKDFRSLVNDLYSIDNYADRRSNTCPLTSCPQKRESSEFVLYSRLRMNDIGVEF